ncbi:MULTISPECIES: BLUF domain-containing protein [unclassified Mucilaginibacter]|uniref:BLUF domain-containing protein n=1 Tax=unclassified Mucilaginibacter TaxID=2617802 RepID=UPI002AC91FD8|nr:MULTISPECIES: BLUF domain-containing protein [unclassified Mucilaginibacter]MEB0262865.1 BLUF domain-containing protein [Mucilaginibacter sp. 10I4]MEB0277088.1 BLUF domain-containing protein [Mucilaginibacter sp. 10B2]MEB0301844.1 BLUF domain-containing protein [Mucilaginibacter sp. 5C4]WPX25189.1 BLUF domain-containing protein [Mucilaginibacter sp. 5C4]
MPKYYCYALHCLCKRGCKPFTTKQLKDLLKESRDNNIRVGITGLLLYNDGAFMQVLEGYEDPVK